jgi:hypothetical protein
MTCPFEEKLCPHCGDPEPGWVWIRVDIDVDQKSPCPECHGTGVMFVDEPHAHEEDPNESEEPVAQLAVRS